MADYRKNRFSFDRKYYENLSKRPVEGSAVRKEEVEYEEDFYDDSQLFTEEYSEQDFASTSPYKKRKNRFEFAPDAGSRQAVKYKKKYNFSFIKLFMLAVVIGAIVHSGATYIQARDGIVKANAAINAAKKELTDIQNYNKSLMGQLDVETDRNYIYTVAVSKLGMIYPKENDTVYYEKPGEGYVRQYFEIP